MAGGVLATFQRYGEGWLNHRVLAVAAETSIPDEMTKGWTFQTLIDEKMAVTAHCHHAPCNHNQKLDLAKLRDRFGPDAPAISLRS
jgi:hypothetical protein